MARGLSPVVGVALLAAITVVLSVSVGLAVTTATPEEQPTARFSLAVDGDDQRVALTHEGGASLSVSAVTVTVAVNGTRLSEQPPVPFFSASGFRSGPTGPFNTASDDTWRAGETASFRLAATNDPTISSGSPVTVTVATEDVVVYEETVTAG